MAVTIPPISLKRRVKKRQILRPKKTRLGVEAGWKKLADGRTQACTRVPTCSP